MKKRLIAATTMLSLTLDKQALPHRQRGLTTVEYALAGALISAALVTAFDLLGVQVGTLINAITDAVDG